MGRVFIHSWHGDFARTEFAPQGQDLGRLVRAHGRGLKLFTCGCGTRHLRRMRRPLWLRLVLVLRLYRCMRCGASVLRSRTRQRRYYPAW